MVRTAKLMVTRHVPKVAQATRVSRAPLCLFSLEDAGCHHAEVLAGDAEERSDQKIVCQDDVGEVKSLQLVIHIRGNEWRSTVISFACEAISPDIL